MGAKAASSSPRRLRPGARRLSVFCGYQFDSAHFGRAEFLALLQDAVSIAEKDLTATIGPIALKLEHVADCGQPLNGQIMRIVRNAHAGVFELSDSNPNVYFELGLGLASRLKRPLLLHNSKAASPVASDVRDLVRRKYENGKLHQILGTVAQSIRSQLELFVRSRQRHDRSSQLSALWNLPDKPDSVLIVCPQLPRRYQPRYSGPHSPPFINLERAGDLDAFAEILTLLPAIAPGCKVKYLTWRKARREELRGHLIVVGGPDYNGILREFTKLIDLPYKFGTRSGRRCIVEQKGSCIFPLERSTSTVTRDYGLFCRVRNPLNPEATAVLVGGIETYGVLGAVLAFGQTTMGEKNARRVLDNTRGDDFAVIVPVNVAGRQAAYGKIDLATLRILSL